MSRERVSREERMSEIQAKLEAGVREIFETYIGESRLIKYQGGFYLELVPRDSVGLFELENILSEFAAKTPEPLTLQGVLNEHGLVMMRENAVSLIAYNFLK